MSDVREQVREHYREAALQVRGGGSCCDSECCGGDRQGGPELYGARERGEAPEAAVLASLGCGNPTAVAELSEGEVVRVALEAGRRDGVLRGDDLGHSLRLEPEVLLLDEPTAGMSLEEVPTIIGLIERIKARRDKTILLVEHKIDMVMALSDSIAVLKDGRLIADDAPEAISRNLEVQAAYFGGGGKGGS